MKQWLKEYKALFIKNQILAQPEYVFRVIHILLIVNVFTALVVLTFGLRVDL